MLTKPLYLEIDKPNYVPIYTVQHDYNSRFYEITILNNSQPLDLTGIRVIVAGKKPDGKEVFNSCKVLDAKKGLIQLELTEQMNAVNGASEYALELFSADGMLSSQPFKLIVTRSTISKSVESSRELGALKDALNGVQNIDQRFAETNAQLSTKASNVDLATERARIDNIIALPEGSTTGDAELQDIRIGIDGEIYDSAGTAVREQIKERTGFAEKVTQYLKEENRKDGYFYARTANYEDNYSTSESASIYPKINIKKGVTYYYKDLYAYFCRVIYEDGSKFNLSDSTTVRVSGSFLAEQDGFILITTNNVASGISAMFADGEIIWDSYTESSYYLSDNLFVDYEDIKNKPSFVDLNEYNENQLKLTNSVSNLESKLEFCSDKVTQYLKEENRKDGYYYTRTANNENNYTATENVSIYPKIEIKKGMVYYYKDLYAYFCRVIYDNGTKFNLSDLTNTRISGSFTAEDNGYILITTHNNASGISAMFADGEIIWDGYIEGSYQFSSGLRIPYEDIINIPEIPQHEINNKYIHVKKDGTGDFTSLVEAIKSIKDSSISKTYTIYVYDDHDMVDEMGGQSYFEGLPENADRASIYIPSYVNIIGVGPIKLFGKIERSWNVTNNIVKSYSLIEIKDGNNRFENLIFETQNTRYAVHDESNGKVPNTKVEWHNCQFRHLGNDEFYDLDNKWISECAYGMGSSSFTVRNFYDCYFESVSFYPFSCHDNYNFKYGTVLTFNHCEFNNKGGNTSHADDARVSTYGTGTAINTASFNNCILRKIRVAREVSSQTEVQNRWKIKGGGNSSTSMVEGSELSMPHFITI